MVQLRRERLVVRQHDGRALHVFDHLRHRERLAGTGDAQQHLVALAVVHATDQLRDGFRLVAAGFVVAGKLEFHVPATSARKMGTAENFYYTAAAKSAQGRRGAMKTGRPRSSRLRGSLRQQRNLRLALHMGGVADLGARAGAHNLKVRILRARLRGARQKSR